MNEREHVVTRTDAYIELKKGFDTMKEELGTMKEENNTLREEMSLLNEKLENSLKKRLLPEECDTNSSADENRDKRECQTCKEYKPRISFGKVGKTRRNCTSCRGKKYRYDQKANGKGAWYLAGFKKGKPSDVTSTSHPFVECERCNDNFDRRKHRSHVCKDLIDMFSSPSRDGLSVRCNACYLIIDRDLALDHKCELEKGFDAVKEEPGTMKEPEGGVTHHEEVEMDSPNKESLFRG